MNLLHRPICSEPGAADRWSPPSRALVLQTDRTDVWRVRLASPAGPDERSATGRNALRSILAAYLDAAPDDLRLRRRRDGKPELDRPFAASGLRFNLSHSGDWLALAVTRGREVGIDIERRRAIDNEAAFVRRVLIGAERDQLRGLSATRRLARIFDFWTCKEAYVKATGQRLLSCIANTEMDVASSGAPRLVRAAGESRPGRWVLRWVPVAAGYAAVLAVPGPLASIRYWTADDAFLGRRAAVPQPSARSASACPYVPGACA